MKDTVAISSVLPGTEEKKYNTTKQGKKERERERERASPMHFLLQLPVLW